MGALRSISAFSFGTNSVMKSIAVALVGRICAPTFCAVLQQTPAATYIRPVATATLLCGLPVGHRVRRGINRDGLRAVSA